MIISCSLHSSLPLSGDLSVQGVECGNVWVCLGKPKAARASQTGQFCGRQMQKDDDGRGPTKF